MIYLKKSKSVWQKSAYQKLGFTVKQMITKYTIAVVSTTLLLFIEDDKIKVSQIIIGFVFIDFYLLITTYKWLKIKLMIYQEIVGSNGLSKEIDIVKDTNL